MTISGHDPAIGTAANYREWARDARGRSPAYEFLAEAVTGDALVLDFLATLPREKRQPNLLFAAARYLLGQPADIAALRELAGDPGSGLAGVMLSHRTQTNEPARCATLLPDKYSYDFAGHLVAGRDPLAPTLRCTPIGPVPLPDQVPPVVWRAGLDLNPLDARDVDDVHWLSCLVWPGEGDRAERLAAAAATARRDPPLIQRGDLLDDLPALAAQAPTGATLVVYHTAVLAYVGPDKRYRFADLMASLPAVWLSNEGPGVVPGVPSPGVPGPADGTAPFLLVRDGHQPVALTDPHGTWVRWLG